jgi:hypothetical protein
MYPLPALATFSSDIPVPPAPPADGILIRASGSDVNVAAAPPCDTFVARHDRRFRQSIGILSQPCAAALVQRLPCHAP